jgi:hypothetical protein
MSSSSESEAEAFSSKPSSEHVVKKAKAKAASAASAGDAATAKKRKKPSPSGGEGKGSKGSKEGKGTGEAPPKKRRAATEAAMSKIRDIQRGNQFRDDSGSSSSSSSDDEAGAGAVAGKAKGKAAAAAGTASSTSTTTAAAVGAGAAKPKKSSAGLLSAGGAGGGGGGFLRGKAGDGAGGGALRKRTSRLGDLEWEGAARGEQRLAAVTKAIDRVYEMSLVDENFELFGNDMIQCFYDVATVTGEPVRSKTLKYVEHLANKWKYSVMQEGWKDDDDTPTPQEVIDVVIGMYCMERVGIRHDVKSEVGASYAIWLCYTILYMHYIILCSYILYYIAMQ